MATTLQALLDEAMSQAGFDRLSAYFTGTTNDAQQIISIANRIAMALRKHPGTGLRKSGTIAMTAATSYALPGDFYEYIADTAYVDGNLTPVYWPTPPDEWALLQAGNIQPGARLNVRQFQGQLFVHNPLNGEDLRFEYLSGKLVSDTSAAAAPVEKWTADNDLWLSDDELFILEFVWRFQKVKGLAGWEASAIEARNYRNHHIGKEQGARRISPSSRPMGPSEPYTSLWKP